MKEPMEHSAFPSEETLAAFIDGRLDEEMRKQVVAHLAECDECYGTVMAAGAWLHEEKAGTVKPISIAAHRKPYAIGLAAAATIAGVLLYPPLSVRYEQRRDTAALRDAANELPKRKTYARLSLDLAYKPKLGTTRGGSDHPSDRDSEAAMFAVTSAAYKLQQDAERDPRIVAQHSKALGLLLAGSYQEATDTLDAVIKRTTATDSVAEAIRKSTDVALLSDLSAAHGARADWTQAPGSAQIAYDAALRAWQLDPKSPKTIWNRAVAIERLHHDASAIPAWNDYIALDPSSPWSDEARERVKDLREGF